MVLSQARTVRCTSVSFVKVEPLLYYLCCISFAFNSAASALFSVSIQYTYTQLQALKAGERGEAAEILGDFWTDIPKNLVIPSLFQPY